MFSGRYSCFHIQHLSCSIVAGRRGTPQNFYKEILCDFYYKRFRRAVNIVRILLIVTIIIVVVIITVVIIFVKNFCPSPPCLVFLINLTNNGSHLGISMRLTFRVATYKLLLRNNNVALYSGNALQFEFHPFITTPATMMITILWRYNN